jgi:hypothetical protein
MAKLRRFHFITDAGRGISTLRRVPHLSRVFILFCPHEDEGAPSFAQSAPLILALGAKGGFGYSPIFTGPTSPDP